MKRQRAARSYKVRHNTHLHGTITCNVKWAGLKDALEKLTSDYQEKQQVVEQLRLENEQLEQSVMDKKEKVTLNR